MYCEVTLDHNPKVTLIIKGKSLSDKVYALLKSNGLNPSFTGRAVSLKAQSLRRRSNKTFTEDSALGTTQILISSLSDLIGWLARSLSSGLLSVLMKKRPFRLT